MRLERIVVEDLTEYWLVDEDGNKVEEVFTPTGMEDELEMWLSGYVRLQDRYEESIEGLRPGESLWVLDPEGSPLSKVYGYCRHCGRLFTDDQLRAALRAAAQQHGPLTEAQLLQLALFCSDYEPTRGCGTESSTTPQWRFGAAPIFGSPPAASAHQPATLLKRRR
ncbi:MAG: hypothetical protein NZ578_14625 [Candidatus Binatia bacterium]|nr:hypothetical protein [Candidatus Binatia bacterium]